MTPKNSKLSRRNFLLTAGAGGAAAAVAVVAGRQAVVKGASTEVAGRSKRGYHETAHTNNYYRTAKV